MSAWRERGYVPPSDGEESDAELSTQESDAIVIPPRSTHTQSDADGIKGHPASGTVVRLEHVSQTNSAAHDRGELMDLDEAPAVANDGFMDVDDALGTRSENLSGRRERLTVVLPAGKINVLDLSNLPDTNDEEEGGVKLDVFGRDEHLQLDNELQSQFDTRVFSSPDPITGEAQLPEEGYATPRKPSTLPHNAAQPLDTSSTTSSPLSSAPSSPTTPPSSVRPPSALRTRVVGIEVVIPQVRDNVHAPPSSSLALDNLALSSPATVPTSLTLAAVPRPRNLRQRKPIQEHPYLIENERYRRACQARGVRPVRLPQMEERTTRRRGEEEDSQEAEYQAPPEREQSHTHKNRGPELDSVSITTRVSHGEPADSAHLHYGRPGGASRVSDGTKRRKMGHTYSKKTVIPGRSSGLSTGSAAEGVYSDRNRQIEQQTSDVYDFPDSQSPLRSPLHGRSVYAALPPSIQNPIGAADPSTPRQRQTLLDILGDPPSSDLDSSPPVARQHNSQSMTRLEDSSPPVTQRPRRRSPSVQLNNDSQVASPEPVPEVPDVVDISSSASGPSTSSGSESSSEEASSEEDSYGIRTLQKRLTGVLPASYLKLEQRKANVEEMRRARERGRSTTPRETQPGVARVRISNRPRKSDQDLFSQESDSGEEPRPQVPRPATTARQNSSDMSMAFIDLTREGEAEEDNRIDGIHPSASRRIVTRKQNRRKSATATRASNARNTDPARPRRYRQTKLIDRSVARTTVKRSSGPRLGIVDAARHHREHTNTSPPTFVKVATRQAMQRRDQGRQSPARKLFVLESAKDTQDVQSVLREWREGTLPFGQHQTRLPSPQHLEDGRSSRAKAPTRSAPHRPQLQSRLRQTDLRDIFEGAPEPPNVPSHAPRRRPHHPQPLAVVPARENNITYRPELRPRNAQFEIPLPGNYRSMRPYGNDRRMGTPAIVDLLRVSRPRQQRMRTGMQTDQPTGDYNSRLPGPRISEPQIPSHNIPANSASPALAPSVPRRRLARKRTPQRLDADVFDRRQPPLYDITLNDDEPVHPIVPVETCDTPTLSGLLPYGLKYSLNFDTTPLAMQTTFNEETFIGRQLLSSALNTPAARISSIDRGMTFAFAGNTYRWGAYKDSSAAEFEEIMDKIGEIAESGFADGEGEATGNGRQIELVKQAYSFYCSFVEYMANRLSFPDPVDLISFGQRVLQAIENYCERLPVGLDESRVDARLPRTQFALQANTFGLVFAFQVSRLTGADGSIQDRLALWSSFPLLGRKLIGRLLRCGLDSVRLCYEDQRQRSKFERGISFEHWLVEAWVIVMQVLDSICLVPSRSRIEQFGNKDSRNSGRFNFWQLFNEEVRISTLQTSSDVGAFERLWRNIFSLLPLYQFDRVGIARRISQEEGLPENWSLLKVLVGRPLEVYDANRDGHEGSVNDYCRVLYARCYHLITKWGWANSDAIIGVLYKFFASKHLEDLKKEVDHGSPDFIHNLDSNPSVEVRDGDRCFHIFLKLIVVGFRSIKCTLSENKIAALVNRLTPNHRRQYPKDEGLQIEHLAALRNHHDLLKTLYWVAPPSCRSLLLQSIRLQVDPEISHRSAVNVAVRAWSDLVRFQLHSGEAVDALRPFAEWFDDLTDKTLAQHHAVRGDVEEQFRRAKACGDTDLSDAQLEDVVSKNQKTIEGILNDLVKSLRNALTGINGQAESASALLTKSSTANILRSYNRVSHKLISEVMELIQQFVRTCQSQPPPDSVPQESAEDSQDYGDWSAFVELDRQGQARQAAEHLLAIAHDALHQMLSNYFGADRQPEDSLLVKSIDTWALVAAFLVQHGLKSWDSYIGHGSESWAFFRATEQKRKFTAYFMTKVIHAGGDRVYQDNKISLLSFWMRTLVERQSMLRFQNEFTSTILRCDLQNPILTNLPFASDENGVFVITQTDFTLRRLSVISTVLTNMREHYEMVVLESAGEARTVKFLYEGLLKAMMQSMKENYQELQLMTSTLSGAYVEFVHQIIEYLQQHAAEIVAVDKFFTDSSHFPLPATDPTYVVGKLKNYGIKLRFSKAHHQLIGFFQTVCERAALDGQQDYLVNQVTAALSGAFEAGDPQKPTLRAVFLHAILPPYIERSCNASGPSGWILAVPILQALEEVIGCLIEDVDSTLYGCVQSAISMISAVLDSMRIALSHLMQQNHALHTRFPAEYMAVLTLMFRILAKVLPLLSWLSDAVEHSPATATTTTETALDCARYLIRFGSYARTITAPRPRDEIGRPVDPLFGVPRAQSQFEPVRQATEKVLAAQERAWQRHHSDGTWRHVRGANVRLVMLPRVEEFSQEGALENVVEEVLRVAARTSALEDTVRCVDEEVWAYESRGLSWAGRVRAPPRGERRGRAMEELGELFC